MVEKYANSSFFVLTSREEGFGNVMTEAESCGLPIIAFDCPYGPREIIKDGYNGFLIRQIGDIIALSNYIIKLIEDEQLRRQMSKNALNDVQRFSVDKIKKQWMMLLNNL